MECKFQVVCKLIVRTVLNIFSFDTYASIFMCDFIKNTV